MNKKQLLVDLNIALNKGYGGIANDNRLIFHMLAQDECISLNGLLLKAHLNTLRRRLQLVLPTNKESMLFFHDSLGKKNTLSNKINLFSQLASLYLQKNRIYQPILLDSLFNDVVWRQVFAPTLPSQYRDIILQCRFHYATLTNDDLRLGSYFNQSMQLNTKDYDLVLFLEPVPISVSPNTKKIVRFHDAIPITDPDLVSKRYAVAQLHALNFCANDSFFVCNSKSTLKTLLTLFPKLENNTAVIPCALSSQYTPQCSWPLLKNIFARRFKNHSIIENEFPYLLHLASLDPKKNQIFLIKAWEKFNATYATEAPIKLVMVGSESALSAEIKNHMQPHIDAGHLLYCEDVLLDEMPLLYSHAKAFVFPSYTEGFGIPPLEAMQCGCPTIVSDIPTHREVYGESPLYCDPYDVDSLTEKLRLLLIDEAALTIRDEHVQNGLRQIKKYSPDYLQNQWTQLIELMTN